MGEMEDFPYEFTKPLLLCFNLLKRCNIGFFDDNVPFLQKYWRSFFIVPCVIIHYISTSIYVSRVFTSQIKISELAFMVPVFLILTQGFLKAAVIIPKRSEIATLIRHLGMMWKTDNLSDIQLKKKNQQLRRLNFGHAVFYWGSIIATWQNLLTPFLLTLFRKFVLKQDTEFLLPFEYAYPFDPLKNWIRYIVVYVFQILTMLSIVYHYIGTEFVIITICAHLSTEFALLREDLKEIIPRKNEDHVVTLIINNDDNAIRNFIQNHQKLIELTRSLNNIFSPMVFIDMFFVTVIMCFFGLGVTVAYGAVDIANNFIAVLALLLPIYILCYNAELLKVESTGIADSAYENLWYNGGAHYQKIIQFIMARSQRPCCLTSLNYVPITLNTFTKVVSTTWSYFSLARSLYSNS
ncbi:odorant receptor 4-like [Nymphalis io]|uniref:odorant receptor 4-like n=1 Tax=Inachis io TaxID=171585 RepID=UPI002169A897|nr:odorant receptor 4-like [Nymphalis io]